MEEQSILEIAAKQGIWALLFITLYLYQLRESRRREQESNEREKILTNFINNISKQFEGLVRQYETISRDLQEIKVEIQETKS